MTDQDRGLEHWIHQHAILFAVLCGAAGFGLATWGSPTPREMFTFYLVGWGAFAVAGFIAQARYLARTCYRDWRDARTIGGDSAFPVENTAFAVGFLGTATPAGIAFVRDLRETLHGGEIVLAMLGALAFGAIASAFAACFFFTAAIGADVITGQNSTWSNVIVWAAGIVAALFSLAALILDPLSGLRYWFASRRLIESEQLSALKILAAATNRTSRAERVLRGDQSSEASNFRSDV